MASKIKLYNDDMFNILGKIEPQSIDLLLTDFPYGTLNKRNKWDIIIDYELEKAKELDKAIHKVEDK